VIVTTVPDVQNLPRRDHSHPALKLVLVGAASDGLVGENALDFVLKVVDDHDGVLFATIKYTTPRKELAQFKGFETRLGTLPRLTKRLFLK
jgi:hypothetical protein